MWEEKVVFRSVLSERGILVKPAFQNPPAIENIHAVRKYFKIRSGSSNEHYLSGLTKSTLPSSSGFHCNAGRSGTRQPFHGHPLHVYYIGTIKV